MRLIRRVTLYCPLLQHNAVPLPTARSRITVALNSSEPLVPEAPHGEGYNSIVFAQRNAPGNGTRLLDKGWRGFWIVSAATSTDDIH